MPSACHVSPTTKATGDRRLQKDRIVPKDQLSRWITLCGEGLNAHSTFHAEAGHLPGDAEKVGCEMNAYDHAASSSVMPPAETEKSSGLTRPSVAFWILRAISTVGERFPRANRQISDRDRPIRAPNSAYVSLVWERYVISFTRRCCHNGNFQVKR
jgi:hypothetical protein